MKIIAAATARNITKDEEKRYNKAKKNINDVITRYAEYGEKETSLHITNLNTKYIDRLLKEFKEAGYVIKNVEYMGRTKIRTMGVYITISWAGVPNFEAPRGGNPANQA